VSSEVVNENAKCSEAYFFQNNSETYFIHKKVIKQARNQLSYWGRSRRSHFLSSPLLSPSPFPSPPFLVLTPKIQLGGLGERCKLPQRVRAEPGRQTHFGAIGGQNFANQVNKLACSQHMSINIMLRCALGVPDPRPFGYGPVKTTHDQFHGLSWNKTIMFIDLNYKYRQWC